MKTNLVKEHLSEIVDLFENKLHSLQMVATKFNCSRQYIKRLLNANGIATTKERSNVKCECIACGKEFFKRRARKRNARSDNDYCSKSCYHKTLQSSNYVEDRHASDKARFKMAIEILGTLKLPAGSIVHHIDSNQTNNDARNLILFNSQANHVRFHRNCPISDGAIIFDGRIDSPQHRKTAKDTVYIMLGTKNLG